MSTSKNMEINAELNNRLGILRDQPARNPQRAARGKAAFLAECKEMQKSFDLSISQSAQPRHTHWMYILQSIFSGFRKEKSPMFGALSTIFLIVSIVLGGSGITVAAAQTSLPDQVLYPVKTWSEDVRAVVTGSSQAQLELALEYTNRRIEEIQKLIQTGKVPPKTIQTRMQEEIDQALRLAAGQPDQDAVQSLALISEQLQEHEQSLIHLGPQANVQAGAILEQVSMVVRDRLQLCDQGIQDPAALRQQLRDRDRLQDSEATPSVTKTTGVGNPWTTGTPTPGSSYGPGPNGGNNGNPPWTTSTPSSGNRYGPEPRDGNGGNNPWTTGTPTPGSGYGPGPQTGTAQPENGNGGNDGSGPDSGNGNGGGSDNGNGGGNGGGKGGGH
jgi:hypothetical protein